MVFDLFESWILVLTKQERFRFVETGVDDEFTSHAPIITIYLCNLMQ